MNRLFDDLVVDPAKQTRATKTRAVSALRSAYAAAHVDQALIHEGVRATVGKQSIPLDFAIANGHLAQLAHAWSFRTQTASRTVQKVKAWSWTLRAVREHGGTILLGSGDHEYVVDRDVGIDVVYDPPESDEGKESLDEALEVFDGLEVTAHPTGDAGLIARDAVDRLAAHLQD